MDFSEVGLRKATSLAAQRGVSISVEVADLNEYDLGQATWDVIVSIFCHTPPSLRRRIHRDVLRALKPGGIFIYEGYALGQQELKTGGPPDPALTPTMDDLLVDFNEQVPAHVITHQFHGRREVVEGPRHTGTGLVNQIVLQRNA